MQKEGNLTRAPVSEVLVTPNTTWQCMNTLLFVGPNAQTAHAKVETGTIALAPSDIGVFSKSSYLPLILTDPYAASIRERLKIEKIMIDEPHTSSSVGGSEADEAKESELKKLWILQRKARALIVAGHVQNMEQYNNKYNHVYADAEAAGSTMLTMKSKDKTDNSYATTNPVSAYTGLNSNITNRKGHQKVRKSSKIKDARGVENNNKKKRDMMELERKRRLKPFFEDIVNRRDELVRHHKNRKSELLRNARMVAQYSDALRHRKEKDEQKEEMLRLQALRQNDMVAYAKLVQETKNVRLNYLMNQTDSYIEAINSMIQSQRSMDGVEDDSSKSSKTPIKGTVDNGTGSAKPSTAATDYYLQTHSKTEKVTQPSMLKGGDLKEYQLNGLQWLVSLYNNNLNGILADEMGLGKTIQTIALLCYIMEVKQNNGPFLIVVPLSTLSNWVNEASKWAPDMIKVVYKGAPDLRKQLYRDDVATGRFNLMLTTYEYIMKDKSSLKKINWQYIIVDEGHRMKNAQSKFAQTLGTLFNSKHRILLTGTPLQNNLPELWALLNFLLPTIFSSVETFDQWFNKPFSQFKNRIVDDANANSGDGAEENNLSQEERMLIVHRLHEVLRPFMLRRVKDQVLDQLPEKVEKVIRCSLSGWQKKIYKVIHHRSTISREKDSLVQGMNNAIMQLRKICNHPYLFLNDWMIDDDLIRCSGKFELLDRILPKLMHAGHRILMFSQMTQCMTILEKFFEYRGFKHLRLDGGTSADEREKRMYMFNDPDSPYFIFLLSTRAGGLGLNLATADAVVIFDSDWNPMMDAQAQDRAHRIGQKNEVRVYRLVTNTIVEEKILSKAADKRNLNGLVVEAGKFNSTQNDTLKAQGNREMMETLLKEWGAGSDGIGEEGGPDDADIPDDDQINDMISVNEDERLFYAQLDIELAQKKQQQGSRRSAVVAAPPRLMEEGENGPSWLTIDSWSPKNLQLGQEVMGIGVANAGGYNQFFSSIGKDNGIESSFQEASDVVGGKVVRKRTNNVLYDDHLTEAQFQKMIEKQAEDAEREVQQQKNMRKYGEQGLDANALSEDICKTCVTCITAIRKLMKPDGFPYCELFREVPEKRLYPDYYVVIPEPISLKEITAKLKKRQYLSIEEVIADFSLMASNAKTYNSDASTIYKDAEHMKDYFINYLTNEGIPFTNPGAAADESNEAMVVEDSFDGKIFISNKRLVKRSRN